MTQENELVVVANRLPVDQIVGPDGLTMWQRSPGGLVTALEPVVQKQGGTWVGWAGTAGIAPPPFAIDGLNLHPVPLSEKDIVDYYEGFSNGTLWPLYHDAVAPPQYHRHWWDRYVAVNHRFAVAAADVAAPGAVVWVQDYQLQLVPAMLRARRPDLCIGFFLHIPFPPVELFAQLPWRAQVVEGLLGADLLGFQRPEGAQNFLRLANYLCGYRTDSDSVLFSGRRVRVGSFSISIDFDAIDVLAQTPEVAKRAAEIRSELGDPRRVVLGVDRLDYIKGIDRRLKAYRELLATREISVGDTVLVQVATPSRERVEHYQQLREEIEREVGRVNGEFSLVGTPAIHYLRQSYNTEELCALYRAADVMLVTPLRDGMNLVAKEYVAARSDLGGALVLSEFTGAAAELTGAFLVNPYDVDGVKRAVVRALQLDPEEARKRMLAMREYLAKHNVSYWAQTFLESLRSQIKPKELAEPLSTLAHYPGEVWVVSDYDGTIAPFKDDPAQAAPAPGARDILLDIAALDKTRVVIVTGRPIAAVRKQLGITSNDPVTIIGLHGFELDDQLGEPLRLSSEQRDLYKQIKKEVATVLTRLGVPFVWEILPPDSNEVVLLEDKAISIAVHVRKLAVPQREPVLTAIHENLTHLPGLTIKSGANVVELLVTDVNKAHAIRLIKNQSAQARLLLIGDDITDLDAISALNENDVTVIVDRRLPELVATVRDPESRAHLPADVLARLTPDVIRKIENAITASDPYAAINLLERWYLERNERAAD